EQLFQNRLNEAQLNRGSIEAGEGGDPDEGALALTDVRRHLRCHDLEDVIRYLQLFALSLLAQDRNAGLQVWCLNIRDESPFEAGAHAVLEAGEVFRGKVAGDDHLFVVIVQGVKRVEEGFLSTVLALQELDVVNEQDVDVTVAG